MKKKTIAMYLKKFFFAFGLFVFLGMPLVMVTNVFGLGSMLSVIGTIKSQCMWKPTNGQIMDGLMSGVAESVNDPYTEYYSKAEWEEVNNQLNYEFAGAGIQLIMQEDNTTVISPIKGGPAEKAGVQSDDVLKYIDGKSTEGMTGEEISSLVMGKAGTMVTLTVFRTAEEKEYEIVIERKIISLPTMELVELEDYPNIAYVCFYQFTESSGQQMSKILEKSKDKKGIVLDLRDNPGGDFYAAIEISDLFLNRGEIVSTLDVKGHKKTYWAHDDSTQQKLIILVNGNSASSSEVLSAALKDNNRALIVGEKTFGKGIIQSLYPLRSGGAIKVTTGKYLTPAGSDLHEVGIEPDYVLSNVKESMVDEQLLKAISLLK